MLPHMRSLAQPLVAMRRFVLCPRFSGERGVSRSSVDHGCSLDRGTANGARAGGAGCCWCDPVPGPAIPSMVPCRL